MMRNLGLLLASVVALGCGRTVPGNSRSDVVIVTDVACGAKGDALQYSDGAMASGSAVFTSSAATFAVGDVGKNIRVQDANSGGSPNSLWTTISAYTNAHTVTLAAANASGATVSGAKFMYGTDDAPAFQTCANLLVNGSGSGEVRIPTPSGAAGYLLASPTDVTSGGAIRVVGEGSRIIVGLDTAINSSPVLSTGNEVLVEISGLVFYPDIPVIGSGARPSRLLSLGGYTATVHDTSFVDQMATDGVIVMGAHNNSVHDVTIYGGNVTAADHGIIVEYYGGVVERVLAIDGNVNGAAAWVSINPSVAPTFDAAGEHPFTFRNDSFDEAGGATHILVKPTGGYHASRVEIIDCDGLANASYYPPYQIYDTDDLLIENSGIVTREAATMIELHNVGRSTIKRLHWQSPAATLSATSSAIITADSNCGAVSVEDSDYDTLSSDATTTTVSYNGRETIMVPATSLATGLLVKSDVANAGRFVSTGTGDASSAVVGVVVKGTAKASTSFTMPAKASVASPSYLYLGTSKGGQGGALTEWRGDGGMFLGAPWTSIDFQTDTTATQIATRAASAFAGLNNPGTLDVTATSSGAVLTISSTVEGVEGDRPVILSASFDVAPLLGGNSHAEIGLKSGQVYAVQIDGANSIAIGDKMKNSTATAGHAAKATSGAFVCTSLSASSATAHALVDCLFQPGII